MPAPVVLHIGAEEGLAKAPRTDGLRKACIEPLGMVGEEVRQRAEVEYPGGSAEGKRVELHTFHSSAEFQGISSIGEKGIVISLKRIPVEQVVAGDAYPPPEMGREHSYNQRSGVLPRNSTQRRVPRQRIKSSHAHEVGY